MNPVSRKARFDLRRPIFISERSQIKKKLQIFEPLEEEMLIGLIWAFEDVFFLFTTSSSAFLEERSRELWAPFVDLWSKLGVENYPIVGSGRNPFFAEWKDLNEVAGLARLTTLIVFCGNEEASARIER